MEKSKYSEIRTDFEDNGVITIDSWETEDENESGKVLGYFVNGEVYWNDPDAQFDPKVKAAVQQLKDEYQPQPSIKRINEVLNLAIKALDLNDEFGNDIDARHSCEADAVAALNQLKTEFNV